MDQTDLKILRCLKENARQNASSIGEQINLSVSAVIERIRKLEASGVIRQYTLLIDGHQVGRDLSAFISVSLEHPKYNEGFIQAIRANTDIPECHYITGEFDYLLKVSTSSTQGLEHVLSEIKSIQGVSATKTLVVLSNVKQDYTLLPDQPF
ncbi:MAG: Lrp/AsnC family transcriptional regulator [Clostridia bacterium]|nr:Lrp/AsnC family transcriptional regulator [Clostridia bacterium]